MIKLIFVGISFISIFASCQNAAKENKVIQNLTDTQKFATLDTLSNEENIKEKVGFADSINTIKPAYKLALTSNALQLVNSETGSTREIVFGKPLEQMVETINKVLQSKVASIGINSECGAGPLKIAVWKNGLNIIFKEQKSNSEWQFGGWYQGIPSGKLKSVQTMAGVGIGTARSEIQSAYVIKVNKTSLGYEFSTSAGLYGIFDGPGGNANITDMWSGTTCIFR